MCPCSPSSLPECVPVVPRIFLHVLLTGFSSQRSGVGLMTLMTQMDCCTRLGIGPKTLRHWLRHAKMQFSTHPADARLKCLTEEQVQQLATLHARALQMAPDPSLALSEEVTPLARRQGTSLVLRKTKLHPFLRRVPCQKRLSCERRL